MATTSSIPSPRSAARWAVTAVVVGAMLVSPLMGPILELGMGFATGSSLLVIRSFLRETLSVVTVTLVAALITLTSPFHE